jgi:hypothetical protein
MLLTLMFVYVLYVAFFRTISVFVIHAVSYNVWFEVHRTAQFYIFSLESSKFWVSVINSKVIQELFMGAILLC